MVRARRAGDRGDAAAMEGGFVVVEGPEDMWGSARCNFPETLLRADTLADIGRALDRHRRLTEPRRRPETNGKAHEVPVVHSGALARLIADNPPKPDQRLREWARGTGMSFRARMRRRCEVTWQRYVDNAVVFAVDERWERLARVLRLTFVGKHDDSPAAARMFVTALLKRRTRDPPGPLARIYDMLDREIAVMLETWYLVEGYDMEWLVRVPELASAFRRAVAVVE